jgi:hypothetical protein
MLSAVMLIVGMLSGVAPFYLTSQIIAKGTNPLTYFQNGINIEEKGFIRLTLVARIIHFLWP